MSLYLRSQICLLKKSTFTTLFEIGCHEKPQNGHTFIQRFLIFNAILVHVTNFMGWGIIFKTSLASLANLLSENSCKEWQLRGHF